MSIRGGILMVLLLALSGCASPPPFHESSTSLEQANVGPAVPTTDVPELQHRLDLVEQRLHALEAMEARVTALESLMEAEQAIEAQGASLPSKEPPAAETYEELVRLLQPEIDVGNIRVMRQVDRLVLRLADQGFFPSGSDRLKPEGIHRLEAVGRILSRVPGLGVQVNGHTDNVPIGEKLIARFPTNLALSRARARQVAEAIVAGGVASTQIAFEGYGEQHPLGNNMLAEGRRQNRRVEVIVFPRQDARGMAPDHGLREGR